MVVPFCCLTWYGLRFWGFEVGCCKLFTFAWIGLGSLRFGCTQHIFPALCYYWAYWAGLDWMGLYRADLLTCFCLVFLPLLSLCLRFLPNVAETRVH